VGALKDPSGDIFATTEWPEEAEVDAVKSFADAHVTGGGESMTIQEDVATEGQRNNNEHQEFLIVLDRLEDEKFAIAKQNLQSR
jgi:hypothetical protein